ncbi:hypothetical protein BpHYR1_007185 [Brachionus plicatilis]|uniref:Uncharacterized protein n=1 Tax=Brachionus plicatilis TaxID=10195 RepID=A0A3M7QYP0_BRAPC|nr:hypothetical protein BpHYR1_007185 [Brachionus plicatilis]
MEMKNVDFAGKKINFENIKENIKFIFDKIEYLKKLINDSKQSNSKCVNISILEFKSILDDLYVRYSFLDCNKTKRFIRKRISRRKRNQQINNQNYYDHKLDDFLKNNNIFSGKDGGSNSVCFNTNSEEFNQTLDQYNKGLFDLKQLNDFSQNLRKLIILRSNQKDLNLPAKSALEEISKLIDEKRLEYEKNKKEIQESIPKSKSVQNKFNALINERQNEINSDYESELSLEQLVYIRYEWDNFLTESYHRSKTVPIEWIFEMHD